MTVYKLLAEIVDALRTSHQEHEAIRAEMATKEDLARAMASIRSEMATKDELAKVAQGLTKLGLDFEAFRHDTKVTLEMISELMVRTGRHEKAIASLDRRTRRIENHLELEPLPEGLDV